MSTELTLGVDAATLGAELETSYRGGIWRALTRSTWTFVGAFIALAFAIVGLIGLMLIVDPSLNHLWFDQNLADSYQPPLHGSLLGTDYLGRSVAWRLVAGIGLSLSVSVSVTVIALVIGTTAGLIAGYYGGLIDAVVSAIADTAWGFPAILLAVMLAGSLQPGLEVVIVAVALVQWAGFARIVRAQALTLKERDFIKAARALGRSSMHIMFRHLLPNITGPLLVVASYLLPVVVIVEAGLTFIGVGAQPPTPSLGKLLADGRGYLNYDPWLVAIPAATLAAITLGLNTLGDGLRDVLDPRQRDRR